MNNHSTTSILVYADYVCPFCYLGYVSLERFQSRREVPVETDWHPFDLRGQSRRPDGSIDRSVDTGKDEAYYEQARQNVERLADEYDVEMAQTLRKDVDSYDAQRVALRARETEPASFEAFHRDVFDALWEEGLAIDDPDVLGSIATDAGLPDGFVRETLDDTASARALEDAFDDAREARITGVPTFVAGEHTARGAVPPDHLERLVDAT